MRSEGGLLLDEHLEAVDEEGGELPGLLEGVGVAVAGDAAEDAAGAGADLAEQEALGGGDVRDGEVLDGDEDEDGVDRGDLADEAREQRRDALDELRVEEAHAGDPPHAAVLLQQRRQLRRGDDVVQLVPVAPHVDVVPRRHHRHQHHGEAEGEVPAVHELGQDRRQVHHLREPEHAVEEQDEHQVLLPYQQHHHRHQVRRHHERRHHTDPYIHP
ncbi:Os04g0401751 [Oryza sativa Japonica Group]|uniref:Os04g0401751 protein n=2 Tax=Oryza sativa subsp. japonica TaxID=39947 RepID=C7J1A5_ORYSJ|nr:Os04g0401750 [Oryza sativa Japonica Group]BAS89047.1 Os04g0401751 [Oryza sativa Japonica Group]|eukprot:NP_001173917.1 Os04g0401750 [Oryza sativa Japonica Group]